MSRRRDDDCDACFENAGQEDHPFACRLYLRQRASSKHLMTLLAHEPTLSVSAPPDYSTQAAVSARCHEVGLWSAFGPAEIDFKPDPWKRNLYALLSKQTGLYTAFAVALRKAQIANA